MPDLHDVGGRDFERRERAKVQNAVDIGARGLKVWKDLGLWLKDIDGKRVRVNDRRLTWLWELAAELRVPVVIHVGDPAAFFEPIDADNERRAELSAHPEYWFGDRSVYPSLAEIHADFLEVLERHDQVTFVGAHFGSFLDLDIVYDLLRRQPRLFVDTAARITDLGRTSARPVISRIFSEFPDRILFGTDIIRTPTGMLPSEDPRDPYLKTYLDIHFRFFETVEILPAPLPEQGDWALRGLGLTTSALERIYRRNADEVFQLGVG